MGNMASTAVQEMTAELKPDDFVESTEFLSSSPNGLYLNVPKKPFIISIEGIIGAGKTTFGQSLYEYLLKHTNCPVRFYQEPFNQDLLIQFINNPQKYAYTFQLYMLTRRQLNFELARQFEGISIIDRSLTGDYVFAHLQNELGNINDEEFAIYKQLYQQFQSFIPDKIIYLNVSTDIAMHRIKTRDRDGENAYTTEYLTNLYRSYKTVLNEHMCVDCIYDLDWDDHIIIDGKIPDHVCDSVLKSII